MERQESYRDPSVLIQAELVGRHPDWINAHAEEFREKYLPEHPEILEQFMKDPEAAVKAIEGEYYH